MHKTLAVMKKTNGLRGYIIYGMTRQQQINFIKRRDNSHSGTSFAGLPDKQVIKMALSVDLKVQADRQAKKSITL